VNIQNILPPTNAANKTKRNILSVAQVSTDLSVYRWCFI